jgi:hypothetical protein
VTNKKTAPREGPPLGRTFGFCRYELDTAQLVECKEWEVDCEDLMKMVTAFVDEGYNVVFKVDQTHECYMASATMQVKDHANYNICMTGRGSTALKAAKQMFFKHRCCDGKWPYYDVNEEKRLKFDD